MQYRRSCPVRDKIIRRYDQELLGAPLSCTTQQGEELWIQGVNVIVPQRYDQSSWRVGLLQCSHSLKGARQVRGQSRNYYEDIVVSKHVVERGEEATTSPVGLSYPKAKRRLERRWTRKSTTVPQRRIYRSRRKRCRCKSTDSRAMGLAAP
ncbi:hypothetical protein BHM03_00004630 [Ensete ventricosum]|nr:hypothetical protein BHM03_00004630 [Ensete ventricosum]